MENNATTPALYVEILDTEALSDEELARACGVGLSWVHEHVQAGVLLVSLRSGLRRFDSTTLIRARRIANLEATYDADLQLAALTVDLIEEVSLLRRRLGLTTKRGRASEVLDA